jgi:hypothetical protein
MDLSLLSVEQTNVLNELSPWPLRQTALYHSFAVVSGQTIFIVLKADTNILKRIAYETSKPPEMEPSSFLITERSFTATLLIQLIVIESCAESWPGYMVYFEEKVRENSIEGKMAPASSATSPMALERHLSRRSTVTTTTTSPAVSRIVTNTKPNDLGRDSSKPRISLQEATSAVIESGPTIQIVLCLHRRGER